jgi:hypothetical protein
MRRVTTILSKADSPVGGPPEKPGERAAGSENFLQLIDLLFHGTAVVALVACSRGTGFSGESVSEEGVLATVENLAAELAACGKRVVVVSVDMLLRMIPIMVPEETNFATGKQPGVWLWPASFGQKIDFLDSGEPCGPGDWLGFLRRNFDSVVLDCPALGLGPGVTEVAAMADATVLAVEAGVTPKRMIQQDQIALQLRGVRVAGCILVQRA